MTVDWDYFFEEPHPGYDWGHSEKHAPGLAAVLWGVRAADLLAKDEPLPRVRSEWAIFWEQFRWDRENPPVVWVTDSHSGALTLLEQPKWLERFGGRVDAVHLFDAHHDGGYLAKPDSYYRHPSATYECDDWMLAYEKHGARLTMRYPNWKTWALEVEPPPQAKTMTRIVPPPSAPSVSNVVYGFAPDFVHIARSGAWVPPWCDQDFQRFVDALLESANPRTFFIGDDLDERTWNPARAMEAASAIRALIPSR